MKNRLLPIETKHTVLNWGLVDYRKESSEDGLRTTPTYLQWQDIVGVGDY